MPTYVDSSVIVSALLNESRAVEAWDYLDQDFVRLTSLLTYVEVRSAIARSSTKLDKTELLRQFDENMKSVQVLGPVRRDWYRAADISENHLLRSLDALHLALAKKFGDVAISFLTFDKSQANAARAMGFSVVGA
jgi:uncharacterized protein